MARLKTSLDAAKSRFNGKINGAAAPVTTYTRPYSYGYNNTLIEAASPTTDRGDVNLVDYDFHRVVSTVGRRVLLSLARAMYWRIPALQSAIKEQANLAVTPFNPIYLGANEKWGEMASDWLEQFHAVMDIQSWPYNYESYCESLIIMGTVDGDIFTLLTEDNSGNPRVQTILSHKVGSRYQTGGTAKVRLEGNTLLVDDKLVDPSLPYTLSQPIEWQAVMIEGAILDGFGRPLAYRVYDDPIVSSTYIDVSARNMFPAFLPEFPGQVRGYSSLSSSVFDWQDVREWKRFEMLAQKVFSSRTLIEENESGNLDESKAIVQSAATFDSSGNKTAPDMVKLDGGGMTVFKAGTNSKLTAFNAGDRPGANSQDFLETTIRDAMSGTEWSKFFSLDPAHVGGAPMRVIVDRINRTIKKRRRLAAMNVKRVDTYALAKAIKNGELPMDPDWYKWSYRGQPDVTADRRYESQTDEMEYQMGWKNQEDIQASRNGDWRQKRNQRQVEVTDLYKRASEISKAFPDISIQEAADRLELMGSANFAMQTVEQDAGEAGKPAPGKDQPPQKKGKQDNKKASRQEAERPSAPMTFHIDAKPAKKRKLKFVRDKNGVITDAEIEET